MCSDNLNRFLEQDLNGLAGLFVLLRFWPGHIFVSHGTFS